MHHGTCVTHVPYCMPGSLTRGFHWSRWREKRSRHSQCMTNPQFYVSGKRPMSRYHFLSVTRIFLRLLANMLILNLAVTKNSTARYELSIFVNMLTNDTQPLSAKMYLCVYSVYVLYFLWNRRVVRMITSSAVNHGKVVNMTIFWLQRSYFQNI